MLDTSTIGVIVAFVGLGLTVAWLVRGELQSRKLLGHFGRLVDTMAKESKAVGDFERQKLLQRRREQEWREMRDLVGGVSWFLEYLNTDGEDD